ncbi:MAG: dockerin type I repeat-containing protein [Ruminococcus sp.]
MPFCFSYDNIFLKGDLNQDGNITLTDLIPLQKHLLLRTNLTTEQSALADLNSDGMINVIDLMLLKRTLLNP